MSSERLRLAAQLLMGLTVALLAFWLAVPGSAWRAGADGFRGLSDQLSYTACLRYFVWDEWRWPLLRAAGLGSIEGTNILFTDSNPLYGLGLRLARRFLTLEFNFLGFWLAICYAAQGIAAVVSLHWWGVRRWAPVFAGAVLAVSVPAWIAGFEHSALCFHAFFLLAAGLPALARRSSPERAAAAALAMGWTLLAMNVYLFVMFSVLVLALFLWLCGEGWTWRRALAGLVVFGGVGILEMVVLGYFDAHGYGGGFTLFSMNLLSPVFPPEGTLLGRLGGRLDATGGQYEGFNYLGLGLLLLLGAAVWMERSRIREHLRHYRPYWVACLGLTLFALSTNVFLGERLILWLPTPPDVISQFRAPGRFFWPVTYLLLVATVVLVSRRGWKAERWLVALALLQWLDVAGLRAEIRAELSHPHPLYFSRQVITRLMEAHERVVVAPSFDCAPPAEQYAVVEAIYRASGARKPVSTVYSGRPVAFDCRSDVELRSRDLKSEPRALAIVLDSEAAVATPADAGWHCARFELGRICSTLPEAMPLLRNVGPPEP
ncbi:MAG: DUF6311 domain-containing protein [Thermoanaerobaculia bacterium]|jgi:hypothetical protein